MSIFPGKSQPTSSVIVGYTATVVSVDWAKMTCSAKVNGLNAGYVYKDIPIGEGPWVKDHFTGRTVLPPGGGHPQDEGDGIHSHPAHRHHSGVELAAGHTIALIPIGFMGKFVMIQRLSTTAGTMG